MAITFSCFSLPKEGEPEISNRDAYLVLELPLKKGYFRVAVADGATQSYLSGDWAHFLVNMIVNSKKKSLGRNGIYNFFSINKFYEKWSDYVREYIQKRQNQGNALKWYEEEGLVTGSDSTLLYIEFKYSEKLKKGKLSAHAIGDTCLAHLHENNINTLFPIMQSVDFNNHPPLISSVSNNNNDLTDFENTTTFTIVNTDTLYLMTDALALWFIYDHEYGGKPWEDIDNNSADNDAFRKWIADLRDKKLLENDDITLIRIQFS